MVANVFLSRKLQAFIIIVLVFCSLISVLYQLEFYSNQTTTNNNNRAYNTKNSQVIYDLNKDYLSMSLVGIQSHKLNPDTQSNLMFNAFSSIPVINNPKTDIALTNQNQKSTMISNSINSLSITSNPVQISGNSAFATQASANSWPGSGTQIDPYIIENLSITTINNYGIAISDTNVYAIIRNNSILATYSTGIYFSNVANILVINNSIINSDYGIRLDSSTNNIFVNNTIMNCPVGIYTYYTNSNSFINNTIHQTLNTGIILDTSNNNTLSSNLITNAANGINSFSSINNTINSNTVANNNFGLYFDMLSTNTIVNNTVHDNTIGMQFESSKNNIIVNNSLINNGFSFNCTISVQDCLQMQVENNSVNGKPFIFYQQKKGIQISTTVGQIVFVNSTNMIIANQNISSTTMPIELLYCLNITVKNNTLNSNWNGVYVSRSNSITIINNSISFSTNYGIQSDSSISDKIQNNTVNSGKIGIHLTSTSYDILQNNVANNNQIGFFISSSNSSIVNNTANSNTMFGIEVLLNHNLLKNNTANFNTQFGIYLKGLSYSKIISNTMNNNGQSGLVLDTSTSNEVTNNQVSYSSGPGYGYALGFSSSNNLTGNLASNNKYGFYIYYSNNNYLGNNLATNSLMIGYSFFTSSSNILKNNAGNSNAYDGIIMITSPNMVYYTSTFIPLNYTLPPAGGVTSIYTDGIANSSSLNTGAYLPGIADGFHNITILYSLQSNIYIQEVFFTVDTTAPIINITNPTNYMNESSITLYYAIIEPNLVYTRVYFDSAGNTSLRSSGYIFTGVNDGLHNITIVAKDIVGHITSKTIMFTVDTINPIVTILGPLNYYINSSSLTLTYSATDANPGTLTVYLDGVANQTTINSGHLYSSIADGKHNLTIEFTDKAGNRAKGTITFVVDTTKPIVSITSPTASTIQSNQVTLIYSITELYIASTIIFLDSVANTTEVRSGHIFDSLSNGQHTLTIVVTDRAGNVGISTINFTIDLTTSENSSTSSKANAPGFDLLVVIFLLSALFIQRKNKKNKND